MAFSWRCCWRRWGLGGWGGGGRAPGGCAGGGGIGGVGKDASARSADLLGAGGRAFHHRRQPDRHGRQAGVLPGTGAGATGGKTVGAAVAAWATGARGRREYLSFHLGVRA